jgi:hypothetical protein
LNPVGTAAGVVCAALSEPDFREVVARARASDTLDRVVAALSTDGPAVPAGLAADLALLERQLAAAGLDGVGAPPRDYRPVPGALGHPVVEVFRCPQGRCERIAAGPEATADPPRCGATGRPLRATRLPT